MVALVSSAAKRRRITRRADKCQTEHIAPVSLIALVNFPDDKPPRSRVSMMYVTHHSKSGGWVGEELLYAHSDYLSEGQDLAGQLVAW